jgi:hypothetical protein
MSLKPAAPAIYRQSALAFFFSKATTTLMNQNLAYLIDWHPHAGTNRPSSSTIIASAW